MPWPRSTSWGVGLGVVRRKATRRARGCGDSVVEGIRGCGCRGPGQSPRGVWSGGGAEEGDREG